MSSIHSLPIDTISLSNLSINAYADGFGAIPMPPLNDQFAKNLTSLRESIRKSGDPRVQLAFVNYLLEAADVIMYDPTQLGIFFDELRGVGEEEAKKKTKQLFIEEAIKWLKKLAMQSGGIGRQPLAEAQFALAEYYGKGEYGLEVDHKKAFLLYIQASKQGHAVAAFRVAACYELGAGTKRDCTRAMQFYRKAAAMGDALAMHKMAKILLNGKLGQEKRPKEGLQWLKRAAAMADEKHPESLHDLATCYTEDEGLPIIIPDGAYAFELFKQAADLGYAPSQHRLGLCYEFGSMGREVNAAESVRYFTLAAEQGYSDSQLSLANWFLVGAPDANLPQSDNDAFRWAQKAAEAGLYKAQYMLGHCYELGIGLPPSLDEARKWYSKSAEQGYKRARQRLFDLDISKRSSRRGQSRCCVQ